MANLEGQTLAESFANIVTKGTTGQLLQDGAGAGITGTLQAFSPTYGVTSGTFTTMTYNSARSGRYIKIAENLISFSLWIVTDNVDTTGASGSLFIEIPFTSTLTAFSQSITIGSMLKFNGASTGTFRAVLTPTNNRIFFDKSTINASAQSLLGVSDLLTGANSQANWIQVSGLVYATV